MNNFLTFGEVYLTVQTNAFIYYLSKLPIVGKLVQQKWYGYYKIKKVATLFGVLLDFVKTAIGNNIGTLAMLYLLPYLVYPEETKTAGTFLVLFLIIKCFDGMIASSALFESTKEDYTFLNHFMVNPSHYYGYKALKNALFSSILLFPAIYFMLRSWLLTVAMVALKLMCILLGNVGFLKFYRWKKRLPNIRARQVLTALTAALAYAGGYFGYFKDIVLPDAVIWGILVLSLIFAVLLWQFHLKFPDYQLIAAKFGNQEMVIFHVSTASTVGEEERGLDLNWEINKEFFEKHKEKKVADYLHTVFFARFGKAIRTDRRGQIAVTLILWAILGLGVRIGWIPVTDENALFYAPMLIAFSAGFSSAGRLSQMYFRNIDLPMLYHHMVTPDFIRSSMLRRYRHILKCDAFYALVIVANIACILLVSGLRLPFSALWRVVAVCILFLIFWDAYEMIVYYVIQPYSVDLIAKSPVFTALGYVESAFNLLVLFVRRDLSAAQPVVILATVAMVGAFLISTRFAHKTFKLRY